MHLRNRTTIGMHRWQLVGVGLAATLALSACGGGGTDTATGSGSAAASSSAGGGGGEETLVGLVTKTDTNPFFVKMKEGATAKGEELGVKVQSFAGKQDGDNQSQVDAIENLITSGAKGILLTPNDS